MKTLVLSVTSGEGHNAMGKAVINLLKARGHDTKMIDYFKQVDEVRQKFSQDIYFWTLRSFPKISHKSYLSIQNRDISKPINKLSIFSFMLNSKKGREQIFKTIEEYDPDIIYCTHVYTATLMSQLKAKGKLRAKVFFIVSDYVVHPYTEHAKYIDYIITPNEDFNDRLLSMGYQSEQFLPLGITVDTKFSISHNKMEARKALGLNPEIPTFMIMNGGVGFGNTLELVEELAKVKSKFQLIIVNGRNQKMKEKIDEYIAEQHLSYIVNYGFATNVDQIMDASDALLGKIGGVAIAEAFNKGLTIIVTSFPPFQEFGNVEYLTKKDAIVYAGSAEKTRTVIDEILSSPTRLHELQQNVIAIRKPNATLDFVNFLESISAKEQ